MLCQSIRCNCIFLSGTFSIDTENVDGNKLNSTYLVTFTLEKSNFKKEFLKIISGNFSVEISLYFDKVGKYVELFFLSCISHNISLFSKDLFCLYKLCIN